MNQPNLNYEQDKFLLEKGKFETYKDKWEILKSAIEANDSPLSAFSLSSEGDYENFLLAVMSGQWTTETGKFFVNITQPIGISSFLSAERNSEGYVYNEQGEIVFNIVDIDEAQLFTLSEIEELIPSEYQNEKFIIPEVEAKKEWSRSSYIPEAVDLEETIVSNSLPVPEEPEKIDYTQNAISILNATMEAFR